MFDYFSPATLRKKRERMGLQRRKGIPAHTREGITEVIEHLLPDLPETVGYRNITMTIRELGYDVREYVPLFVSYDSTFFLPFTFSCILV